MSRALNINAAQADVAAACAKRNIGISAIETLHSGGTRVVTNNIDETLALAKFYRSKVISGLVTRAPLRLRHA